ncbi:alpha/beta hydrolase [Actinomadura barringtoniae]|uniref:Alpha/beta hydrolase n=1 Tax=Actinomadura barringtoniae TaxID=1427535 RepID=A0A939T320_9ACTN|nr:alpha/beta hydrolase [Actinomadura barringtoniae]MBO2446049.1 alpha/beta hydrolase [Actinomadura barringtoniae]
MHNSTIPQTRRIDRPDAVLRGEETGTGPTVLLLHAGGERRRVWKPVVEVLVDAGFRCVAYDQRGHGESEGSRRTLASYGDDVAAMLEAEPPGCVVVGASLGGLAALTALADPAVRARVAGLVLVDVVPGIDPGRARRFLAARDLLDVHTELVDDILGEVPRLCQVTEELAQTDLPLHFIHGGDGSPVTPDDVDHLLALVPHATMTRIPNAGHLVARDQPVALAEALTGTHDWPALALLRELGAPQIDHPGGNLFEHLKRVSGLVADWGGSRGLRLTALCHATYGTDGFPQALLPLDQRARLRTAIGDDAEEQVYLYDACHRDKTYAHLGETPLPLTDRFTGETSPLADTDLSDFALLSIANELDVVRNAALSAEVRGTIRSLITALAAYAPDAGVRALADPAFR